MSGIDENVEKFLEEQSISTSQSDESYSHEEAIAEALVFASGSPVRIESIAIALKTDKKKAARVMDGLVRRYEDHRGGIMLRKVDKSYVFCSNPELHPEIRDYFERPSSSTLSRAAMETLSIIAYNQPVTRNTIEFIRGVNSDGVLVRLIERGLVTEVGRSENPGRPILYGTTIKFLQSIGLETLDDLPPVEKINIQKDESEEEIKEFAPEGEIPEESKEESQS